MKINVTLGVAVVLGGAVAVNADVEETCDVIQEILERVEEEEEELFKREHASKLGIACARFATNQVACKDPATIDEARDQLFERYELLLDDPELASFGDLVFEARCAMLGFVQPACEMAPCSGLRDGSCDMESTQAKCMWLTRSQAQRAGIGRTDKSSCVVNPCMNAVDTNATTESDEELCYGNGNPVIQCGTCNSTRTSQCQPTDLQDFLSGRRLLTSDCDDDDHSDDNENEVKTSRNNNNNKKNTDKSYIEIPDKAVWQLDGNKKKTVSVLAAIGHEKVAKQLFVDNKLVFHPVEALQPKVKSNNTPKPTPSGYDPKPEAKPTKQPTRRQNSPTKKPTRKPVGTGSSPTKKPVFRPPTVEIQTVAPKPDNNDGMSKQVHHFVSSGWHSLRRVLGYSTSVRTKSKPGFVPRYKKSGAEVFLLRTTSNLCTVLSQDECALRDACVWSGYDCMSCYDITNADTCSTFAKCAWQPETNPDVEADLSVGGFCLHRHCERIDNKEECREELGGTTCKWSNNKCSRACSISKESKCNKQTTCEYLVEEESCESRCTRYSSEEGCEDVEGCTWLVEDFNATHRGSCVNDQK